MTFINLLRSFCCNLLVVVVFFFFFSSRRRHTRCLSDWSSDVCSSDLASKVGATVEARLRQALARDGRHTDQLLWSIVKDEWSRSMVAKTVWGSRVH